MDSGDSSGGTSGGTDLQRREFPEVPDLLPFPSIVPPDVLTSLLEGIRVQSGVPLVDEIVNGALQALTELIRGPSPGVG